MERRISEYRLRMGIDFTMVTVIMPAHSFNDLGKDFEKVSKISTGSIGMANSKLMRQRAIVDYATQWITGKRNI